MDINIISHIIASYVVAYVLYRVFTCVIYYKTLINNMYKLHQITTLCIGLSNVLTGVATIFTGEQLMFNNKRISKLTNILFDVNNNVSSSVYKNKFNDTTQVIDTSNINTIIDNLCNKMQHEQNVVLPAQPVVTQPVVQQPVVQPPVTQPVVQPPVTQPVVQPPVTQPVVQPPVIQPVV